MHGWVVGGWRYEQRMTQSIFIYRDAVDIEDVNITKRYDHRGSNERKGKKIKEMFH